MKENEISNWQEIRAANKRILEQANKIQNEELKGSIKKQVQIIFNNL